MKRCQGVWYIHAYINSYTCTHHSHYIHIIYSNIQSSSFPLRWVLFCQTLTFDFPNKLATWLSPYHVNSVSETNWSTPITCDTCTSVCVWCANVWMETRGQHQVFSSRYACLFLRLGLVLNQELTIQLGCTDGQWAQRVLLSLPPAHQHWEYRFISTGKTMPRLGSDGFSFLRKHLPPE